MKQILLGAFEINQVNLTSQGSWAHPQQTTYRYTELGYWTELARLLERGMFDFMFLADSYGYPSIDGVTPRVAIEQAVELPNNDPMMLISAMAAVTSDLCFGVTASTTFEHPYANARRLATLDHLTGGRVGWNVVTTSMAVVSQLFGQAPIPHDERYARATEFLELTYRLLEGGWEEGSVLADKAVRRYADPDLVHEIHHEGSYFRCHGYFDSEPSPQRTPVLFQAGASEAGRSFGAANAEVVFLHGRDPAMLRQQVQDVRARAIAAGRAPGSVKAVSGLSVVTAETRQAAQRKMDDFLSYVHPAAANAYYAAMTGIDLAALDPDATMEDVTTDGSQTQVARYRTEKVRQAIADFQKYGMRELTVVGTAADAAAEIAALVEETDLDGFLYTPFVTPGSYREFADDLLPELQRIGLVRRQRVPGTFRERIFGPGQAHLPSDHPADRARHHLVAAGSTAAAVTS